MTFTILFIILAIYYFLYLMNPDRYKNKQKYHNKNQIQQNYLKTIEESKYNDYSYTKFMKKFYRSCRISTVHAKTIEIFKGNGIKKVWQKINY